MMNELKDFKILLCQIEKQGLDLEVMLNCFPTQFHKQHWNSLSEDPELTDQMVIKYANFLNWNVLSGTYNFNLKLLQKYEDKINWPLYSQNPHITEQIIRYYADRLEWFNILITFKFDLNFIREFKDYINFSFMLRNSKGHTFPLNVINEFKDKFDKLDWDYISRFDNLTDIFIEKNIERLNLNYVQKQCTNKKLKTKIKKLYKLQRKLKYV